MEHLDTLILSRTGHSQLLRMTFKNTDYSFRVIKPIRIHELSQEIDIVMDGTTLTLLHQAGMWTFKDPQSFDVDFVTALGRTIWLRYRF